MLEPLVDLRKSGNKERAKKLLSLDRTFLDTKFWQKIKEWLKVEESDIAEMCKINSENGAKEVITDINGRKRMALAFEGSAFGKLTARALNRTTILGVAALSLLELPKIFKAMGDGNNIVEQTSNTAKQTVKSGTNLASVTAGIAYGGAIGSKYGGPLGSLIGIGTGAVFGSLVSKKIQEVIF